MDSIHKQVSALHEKVDALHQLIEQLSDQLFDVLSTSRPENVSHRETTYEMIGDDTHLSHRSTYTSVMEHKDVLVDGDFAHSEYQPGEPLIAPEVQIQRLTAQLTAAYNRIAALEEQLLSKHVH